MLWIRGLIFTALVPFMIAVVIPRWIAGDAMNGSAWGWPLVGIGALFYLASLLAFLAAGGTPSIYFLRPLRHLLGEEPGVVVEHGLYRVTRNPMYVGVLTAIQGFALLYGSWNVALFGVLFGLWLHFVVTRIEEPHLRKDRGEAYENYCRRVPRWLGIVS